MYFLGVTTAQSAIQRIFQPWCNAAARQAELVGIDIPVGAPPAAYCQALARIHDDPHSAGALVTTHKIAIVDHAREHFHILSPASQRLGEVSCIVKRDGRLHGDTLDPYCAGVALMKIAGPENRDVLILGCGGAGTAIAFHLEGNSSRRVHATDTNPARLARIQEFGVTPHPEDNDTAVASMPPGSIIVNATGLGKDLPGSPVTPGVRWPADAIAWELNYRGELKFLDYANQAGIKTADGWEYFVLGWSSIMSRVLAFELTEELQSKLQRIAVGHRKA